MSQLPPWSYSMLECFGNCPRMAYHRYILKEKAPQTEAMRKGNEFDKAVEDRLLKGAELPAEWRQYEPFAASLANRAQGTKLLAQFKMGLTRDFKPCGFFDNDVWARGAIDVALINYPTAIITDWKTGKNSEGKAYSNGGLQLKIFTLFLFKHFPKLEKITAFNLWLKTNELGKPLVFTRADEPVLWREVLQKVMEMETAFAKMRWPEQPGPLCGYCPVRICQNNKA